MKIEATNNFRYRTITLDGQNYLVDVSPKGYMILFGIFSFFSSLQVYPITENEKELIRRRGAFDNLSIGVVPILGRNRQCNKQYFKNDIEEVRGAWRK